MSSGVHAASTRCSATPLAFLPVHWMRRTRSGVAVRLFCSHLFPLLLLPVLLLVEVLLLLLLLLVLLLLLLLLLLFWAFASAPCLELSA